MPSLPQYAQRGLVVACLLAVAAGSAGPTPDAFFDGFAGAPVGAPVSAGAARSGLTLRSTDQVAPVAVAAPVLPPAASTTTPVLAPLPPTLTVAGVPARAVLAYRAAADRLAADDPSCRLPWQLVAAIGYVESGHGSVQGAAIGPDGRVTPEVLGPRLDGSGAFALIRDSDGGTLDGDRELDRAVGPMQFIPSTWARHGADGDGDGRKDPHDLDDAALAAGRYLCASARRVDRPANTIRAVFSYNHSYDYVRLVLTVAARYAGQSPERWGVGLLPAPAGSPAPSPSPSPSPAVASASPAPAPAGSATPVPPPEPTGSPTPTRSPKPTGSRSPSASPEPSIVAPASPPPDPLGPAPGAAPAPPAS